MQDNYFDMSESYSGDPTPHEYTKAREIEGLVTSIWVEIDRPSLVEQLNPFNDKEQRYLVVCKAHYVKTTSTMGDCIGVSPIAGGNIDANLIADYSRIAICRAVRAAKNALEDELNGHLNSLARSLRTELPRAKHIAYRRLMAQSNKKPTHH